MAVDSVSAAKLAVYLVFTPFSLFCIFTHGRTGILGWWYVVMFCGLRIVTGAIGIHGDRNGETYNILNSIGISPLMLAVSGILHEGRCATNPRLRRKLDGLLEVQYHVIVGVGMVLLTVAVLHLENDKDISSTKTLLDVGSGVSCAAWGLLVLWALVSLLHSRMGYGDPDPTVVRNGRLLLFSCLFTLPLIALRIAWGVAFLELKILHPGSDFLTSQVITICLGVVPEMVIIASLLLAGVCTHRLYNDMTVETTMSGKART